MKSQAKWAGHVHRNKDTLKATFKDLQIDIQGWEEQTADRSTWRHLINEGAQTAETNRTELAMLKRAKRKNQSQIAMTAPEHTCSVCGRHFRARIGLISHMRTHK